MDYFNLNSNSYTDSEIEDLFNLKHIYNEKDIDNAKQKLIRQLSSNQDLETEKQREITVFIDTIANRIYNKLSNYNKKQTQTKANPKIKPYMLPHDNKLIVEGSNFIIESEDTLAGKHSHFEEGRISADGVPVPAGYINPINVRTISRAISFDTRFRSNYYNTKSTNFDFTLPIQLKNVVSMTVASLELPITYYAISRTQGNSSCLIIQLPINPAPAETPCWILTIPDGNYSTPWGRNGATLINVVINNCIALAQPATIDSNGNVTIITSGGTLLASTDLSFELDTISGRSIFSNDVSKSTNLSNGFIIRFNVHETGSLDMDTSIQMRFGWQLGFRSAEYVCSPPSQPNSHLATCVSEGICLISGTRYAFLSIDDYQKNTGPDYIVCYGNSFLHHNLITRINIATYLGAEIYQFSADPGLTVQSNRTRMYYGPVDIHRLHIALYDDFGRIIDLNNMDWSFSLTFEVLYS